MITRGEFLVYHTAGYEHLYEQLFAANDARPQAERLTLIRGKLERKQFEDGERYYRFLDNPYGRRVLIIGGTPNPNETHEMVCLGHGLQRLGAYEIDIVDAFFGHSTMERDVLPGEVVTAKVQALIKSSIPHAPNGNWFFNLDLHTEGLPGYYENGVHAVHWHCEEVLAKAIQSLKLENFVFGSTDLGRGSWIKSYARKWGVKIALIDKRRYAGGTEVDRVIGIEHVHEKNLVLFDDMFRTCGSAVHAAQMYRAAGARDIYLVGTHGLFSNGALTATLRPSGLFAGIICTDTHPNAVALSAEGVQVVSVAPLIVDRLYRRDFVTTFGDAA